MFRLPTRSPETIAKVQKIFGMAFLFEKKWTGGVCENDEALRHVCQDLWSYVLMDKCRKHLSAKPAPRLNFVYGEVGVYNLSFGRVSSSRQSKRACSALDFRNVAKPSCSCVNRSRTIALGVARLQNGLAPLQNAFTALQNGLAPLQNAFATLFHVLAVVRGAIARLFRRLDGLLGFLVVRRGVACAVRTNGLPPFCGQDGCRSL